MEPITIRSNANARDDFLRDLARDSRRHIARVTVQMIGIHATEDVIRNDASQAFLIGANRGIDTFRIGEGQGESSFEQFCRWRGLNYVKDYCRREFGTETRSVGKHYFERQNVILESDLYESPFAAYQAIDNVAYDESICSLLTIQGIIKKLSPVDRSILQLLIFGADEFGTMRNASFYGSRFHNIASDIALTIGRSKQFVYQRLSVLKKTYEEFSA